VQANDYNPNSVATNEMRLLHTSISADGYTQPCVAIYDPEIDKYVIVDGFHRYTIMRTHQDIYETTGGYLPVVVIDKPPADRMASTVRHNRARGKHSVAGMSSLVFQMLQEGKSDAEICNAIGLEAQELLRLKHITGFAKLLKDHEYNLAWDTPKMVELKQVWQAEHPDEPAVI
jgi:ParB-like chromosome segregation protein Spo0J